RGCGPGSTRSTGRGRPLPRSRRRRSGAAPPTSSSALERQPCRSPKPPGRGGARQTARCDGRNAAATREAGLTGGFVPPTVAPVCRRPPRPLTLSSTWIVVLVIDTLSPHDYKCFRSNFLNLLIVFIKYLL